MKPIISNDLMNRIKCAAANESIVAKTLLQAIKDCRDIANETNSTINYFDSKRYVHGTGYTLDGDTAKVKAVRAVVTCCRKDVTNPNFPDYGNPQAPYFSENRNEISVQDFAKVFRKSGEPQRIRLQCRTRYANGRENAQGTWIKGRLR